MRKSYQRLFNQLRFTRFVSNMNEKYKSYIRDISNKDLIPIIQKSQYGILAEIIRDYGITGNDLLTLKRDDVILKFRNNVKQKPFLDLLRHVQTTPADIFPLKPAIKPKLSRHAAVPGKANVESELENVLSKRRANYDNNQNTLQTNIRKTPSPRNELRRPELTTNKPKGTNQNLLSKPVNTVSKIVQKPTQSINTSFGNNVKRPILIPEQRTNYKQHDQNSLRYSNNRALPNSVKLSNNIATKKLHAGPVVPKLPLSISDEPKEHDQEHDELPEYINTFTTPSTKGDLPEYSNLLPRTSYSLQDDDTFDEDLPEYINVALPEEEQLNDPHTDLAEALREAVAKFNRDEYIQTLGATSEDFVEELHSYEDVDNDRDDDFSNDSHSHSPQEVPQDSQQEDSIEPPVPERPAQIFRNSHTTVKVIKRLDGDKSRISEPSPPKRPPSVTISTTSTTTSAPSGPGMYGRLPSIANQHAPDLPPDANIPEDNEYEEPVSLGSPQFVIRRNRFFREVSRTEGDMILANRPVGTFLLRPSRQYLATLMFVGVNMINNVPICYDDINEEYYLATKPGTVTREKFKNMMLLLNYYSSATMLNNEMILDPDLNFID